MTGSNGQAAAQRGPVEKPSAGFLRLVWWAIGLTFALVLVGGVVRVSDSGLGCGPEGAGTEGWPLCGGRVVPLVDTNMIVEYSHRVLASVVAISIGAIALLAWRRYHQLHTLRRLSVVAFGLVLFQAALGGLTVEKGLDDELVAAHLGVAMLQIALLLAIAFSVQAARSRPGDMATSAERAPAAVSGAVRLLAVGACLAVLGTIVAGGYMSANELHGTGELSRGTHTACGEDFPSCGGEFLPFGRSRELDIHLTHRVFMYLSSALMLALVVAVFRDTGRRRTGGALRTAALVALGVFCGQALLGALNVWLGKHAGLVVAHLAIGTLLWCSLVVVALLALRAPSRVPERSRRAEVEAVPV
jgi:heme A synthase